MCVCVCVVVVVVVVVVDKLVHSNWSSCSIYCVKNSENIYKKVANSNQSVT
jgi:hypothetical protein